MKKLISLMLVFLLCLSLVPAFGAEEDIPTEDTLITLGKKTLSVKGDGVELDESDIVIKKAGVYRLSGTFDGFRVIVKAEGADVTLLLDNAVVINPKDEAVYVKSCASFKVIALPGTENTLTSGKASELEANKASNNSGAALRAKCPMTVSGSGSLAVNGYINNGVAAEGSLTLTDVTLSVTSANDGIKSDCALTVESGSYTVTSGHDAFYAGTILTITDGSFTVFTGVGSADADMNVSDSSMMGNFGGGGFGNRSRDKSSSDETDNSASDETEETTSDEPAEAEETTSEEPTETEESASEEPTETDTTDETEEKTSRRSRASREMPGGGGMPGMFASGEASSELESVSDSAKGLKAAEAIKISGGTFLIDAEDDAVHSDGTVLISGGDMTLYSGDDGIHGTELLYVTGGTVFVKYCFEGFEGGIILVDDGVVNITATDDGFNASTGRMGGFGGSGEASSEPEDISATPVSGLEGPIIRIRGGSVTVDSGGDGLDSNGSLYIYGGTVRVSGPSTDWDGAIDTGEGGSTFLIAGGNVMAAGYSGMAETPESAEASQCSIYCTLDEAVEDGALCTLADSDGNILQSFAFVHSYNCVIFSTPALTVGETYTVTVGDTVKTIELTDTVYSERRGFGPFGR